MDCRTDRQTLIDMTETHYPAAQTHISCSPYAWACLHAPQDTYLHAPNSRVYAYRLLLYLVYTLSDNDHVCESRVLSLYHMQSAPCSLSSDTRILL